MELFGGAYSKNYFMLGYVRGPFFGQSAVVDVEDLPDLLY